MNDLVETGTAVFVKKVKIAISDNSTKYEKDGFPIEIMQNTAFIILGNIVMDRMEEYLKNDVLIYTDIKNINTKKTK